MGRGWQLGMQSWRVLRADRSLLVFPVISALAGIVVAVIFFGAGAGVYAATDKEWAAIPFAVVGAYGLILIGTFANVALCSCADRSLRGEDTTVSEGITAARARGGEIVAWAGVQLVVTGVISVIQAFLREGAGQLVASIVGGLANLAWAVASFFAMPAIALEGAGPKEALKRSTSLIRERWGEGVTGSFAIGVITLVFGFLPGVLLVVGGVAAFDSAEALGVALITLGVVVFAVAALVQSALTTVFKVALFRFATSDEVVGGFQRPDLEAAFRPSRRRGRRRGVA